VKQKITIDNILVDIPKLLPSSQTVMDRIHDDQEFPLHFNSYFVPELLVFVHL
jgi:hypothetical protein